MRINTMSPEDAARLFARVDGVRTTAQLAQEREQVAALLAAIDSFGQRGEAWSA